MPFLVQVQISGRHCHIYKTNIGWVVNDVSTNGENLNLTLQVTNSVRWWIVFCCLSLITCISYSVGAHGSSNAQRLRQQTLYVHILHLAFATRRAVYTSRSEKDKLAPSFLAGTYVNGVKVGKGNQKVLHDRDIISVSRNTPADPQGAVEYMFGVEGESSMPGVRYCHEQGPDERCFMVKGHSPFCPLSFRSSCGTWRVFRSYIANKSPHLLQASRSPDSAGQKRALQDVDFNKSHSMHKRPKQDGEEDAEGIAIAAQLEKANA